MHRSFSCRATQGTTQQLSESFDFPICVRSLYIFKFSFLCAYFQVEVAVAKRADTDTNQQ